MMLYLVTLCLLWMVTGLALSAFARHLLFFMLEDSLFVFCIYSSYCYFLMTTRWLQVHLQLKVVITSALGPTGATRIEPGAEEPRGRGAGKAEPKHHPHKLLFIYSFIFGFTFPQYKQ